MAVQVLVATMNQKDCSLLDKMNIQTDAIVCNQCERNEFLDFAHNGRKIRWLSFNEKGVGLNRNNALMRATEDIVLFADDDVVYCDNYETVITEYYKAHPEADIVIFNFKMRRGDAEFYERVTKEGRVGKKGAMKYGTYCISARREKLRFANVFFHQDFGGGAKYSCGEDSLFLQDCLRKKLKIYSCKGIIGVLDHGPSTWFSGYSDKFFFDKGVLFYLLNKSMCSAIAMYHCIKHRKKYSEYGWRKALSQMKKGIKHAKGKIG
ncbi:MAG: glycosyltransferase family 2 protein [Clostridia bacterium]|nr:glycosyltransferase family 2 protein [Clostridia bacterium]